VRLSPLSIIAAAGLILAFTSTGVRGEDPRAAFDSAARLYEQGKHPEAMAAYIGLLTNGVVTPSVLYNLGNAWLQQGELGHAIAAYRQAQRLRPRDPDLTANLRFARSKVAGLPHPERHLTTRLLSVLTPNEWAGLALVVTWVAGGWLIVRDLRRKGSARAGGLAGVLVVLAILCTAAAMAAGYKERNPTAVLTAETIVRFGPLEESQQAFTLPDGAEVGVTDHKGGWLEIRDTAGRSGWLNTNMVVYLGEHR
jgi:tetratricopeptide (TPR) repeat protein